MCTWALVFLARCILAFTSKWYRSKRYRVSSYPEDTASRPRKNLHAHWIAAVLFRIILASRNGAQVRDIRAHHVQKTSRRGLAGTSALMDTGCPFQMCTGMPTRGCTSKRHQVSCVQKTLRRGLERDLHADGYPASIPDAYRHALQRGGRARDTRSHHVQRTWRRGPQQGPTHSWMLVILSRCMLACTSAGGTSKRHGVSSCPADISPRSPAGTYALADIGHPFQMYTGVRPYGTHVQMISVGDRIYNLAGMAAAVEHSM